MEPERIDRYRLDALLDQAGGIRTYQAWDERLNRPVLLKQACPSPEIDLADRERFLHAARALGRLRHPHIVALHDVGIADECPFLVAEWLPGTLQVRLAEGPLPSQEARQLISALTDALAVAFRAGVTTLLPNPVGVRFTTTGQIKLLDQVGKHPGANDGTEAVALMQLGRLLYHLLVGHPPATPEPTPPQVINPAVPADLGHLALALIGPGVQDRVASLTDLAQVLGESQGAPRPAQPPLASARPATPVLPVRWQGVSRAYLLIAGGLLVLVLLAWSRISAPTRTAASLPRATLVQPQAEPETVSPPGGQIAPGSPPGGKAEPPPPGEQDRLYSIRLREPSVLVARLYRMAASIDFDLYLYDAGGQELGRSTQGGNAEERIELPLPAGEYHLRVHYLVGAPSAGHQVRWHWTPLAP